MEHAESNAQNAKRLRARLQMDTKIGQMLQKLAQFRRVRREQAEQSVHARVPLAWLKKQVALSEELSEAERVGGEAAGASSTAAEATASKTIERLETPLRI